MLSHRASPPARSANDLGENLNNLRSGSIAALQQGCASTPAARSSRHRGDPTLVVTSAAESVPTAAAHANSGAGAPCPEDGACRTGGTDVQRGGEEHAGPGRRGRDRTNAGAERDLRQPDLLGMSDCRGRRPSRCREAGARTQGAIENPSLRDAAELLRSSSTTAHRDESEPAVPGSLRGAAEGSTATVGRMRSAHRVAAMGSSPAVARIAPNISSVSSTPASKR